MSNELIPGPIFIFASGQRCGSTLLQRAMTSHPDVIIWGEHDGTLGRVLGQFDRLLEWHTMFGHQYHTFLTDGYNNFIPNMNPPGHVLFEAQKQLIETIWKTPALALGKSTWGFKEVMYGADMAFRLKEMFAGTRIIHMSRNIFDCFISLRHEEMIPPNEQLHVPVEQIWTRSRTIEFIDTWTEVNQSMLETPGLTEDWVYHLTYEELIASPKETMRQLSAWLNLDDLYDYRVFDHKLYTDRHKGKDPRPKVTRADLSKEEIKLLTTNEIMRISHLLRYDMSIPQSI